MLPYIIQTFVCNLWIHKIITSDGWMILHQNARLINGHRNKTVGDCRSSFRSVPRQISTDLSAGKKTASAPPYGVIDNDGRQFIRHLCNSSTGLAPIAYPYVKTIAYERDRIIVSYRNYRNGLALGGYPTRLTSANLLGRHGPTHHRCVFNEVKGKVADEKGQRTGVSYGSTANR